MNQEETREIDMFDIAESLEDLSVLLERAKTVICNLSGNYFGDSVKMHQENNGAYLVYGYDEARNFAEIGSDYIFQALELTEQLGEQLMKKRGNGNEN